MNIFEEKTDSELLSYFSDYQKLCSLDKYVHQTAALSLVSFQNHHQSNP